MNNLDQKRQDEIEHKRSVTAAISFVVGFSLLLIGFILIMRTLFAPKAQYNGNSSINQFEQDQEGEFYQNEQNSAQPSTAPATEATEE
jgi:hypothetical protein